MDNLVELENIHLKMKHMNSTLCVSGKHKYYHYKCDGFDDIGWGCGYRTAQTICSWLRAQLLAERDTDKVAQVPSILEIQKILAECGDKPTSFVGSKEWIGSFEVMIVIDSLYNVPCRILHCNTMNSDLCQNQEAIRDHFEQFGGPIMMGGDMDAASKGILGYGTNDHQQSFLLIADPHFKNDRQPVNVDYLLADQWVAWRALDSFEKNSFYNFCMPQKKAFNK